MVGTLDEDEGSLHRRETKVCVGVVPAIIVIDSDACLYSDELLKMEFQTAIAQIQKAA